MANDQKSNLMWYIVWFKNNSKAPDICRELTKDEPEAKLEVKLHRRFLAIRTALSWDFLRENLPDAVVGIYDVRNNEETQHAVV